MNTFDRTQLQPLYVEHLSSLRRTAEHALGRAGFDGMLIYSGAAPMQFLDDQGYPFKVNPHFKHWLPVLDNPECFLLYMPSKRPRLLFNQPVDYWHKPAALPQDFWTGEFELIPIADLSAVRAHLPSSLDKIAFIGELPSGRGDWPTSLQFAHINPASLLNILHFQRATKSAYEIECIQRANHIAARGHRAAELAFRNGGSEFDAHQAYLSACGQREEEVPYNNIVAINTNAAVLHYQHLERTAPATRRSFLIDAGATYNGYASDITRTYSAENDDFAALIAGMDQAQQRLCALAKPNTDWADIHLASHREVATLLHSAGIITATADTAVETGLTSLFYPHGIGHLLGLQVHDIGGFLADDSGAILPKPKNHPYLRLTRKIQPGFTVTVEPGLYFIDSLLNPARASALGKHINWNRVETFRPYGGIRIEDNVAVTVGAPNNMTRKAFQA